MPLTSKAAAFTRNAPGSEAATREVSVVEQLTGATGTVSVVTLGGVTITGTVDVTGLALLPLSGDTGAGGALVKITDTAAKVWLIPAGNIVAVGQ